MKLNLKKPGLFRISLAGFTLAETLVSMVLITILATGFWGSLLFLFSERTTENQYELIRRLPVLADSIRSLPAGTFEWKRGNVLLKAEITDLEPGRQVFWSLLVRNRSGKITEKLNLITRTWPDEKQYDKLSVYTKISR